MKLIVLGAPGSGKGTVAEQLHQEFKLFSLSAGELLREEVAKNTTLGKEIKKYMEKGNLVPDTFVTEMVKLEVKTKKEYILDGFPRSVEQAKAIADLKITKVIYLDVPEKIVIERLSGRRICKAGKHTYHLKYLPPKKKGICDKDKTRLIQRKDDYPKAIRERFKVYHHITQPVIHFYQRKKILQRVDASQSPEKVYAAVKKILRMK
ncbi:MAG: nucleoside monophosphate kinase [Nanoarchaeota archaeon]|nr:nucleoside monophosphate kinase [Nanoarchaeota archaeon]